MVWAKKYSISSMSCVATPEQIAGASASTGRAGPQRHQLAEEAHAHVREQAIGHVVREPGLEPVEHAGGRRHQQQRHQQCAGSACRGSPRRHDEARLREPDADQRGDRAATPSTKVMT